MDESLPFDAMDQIVFVKDYQAISIPSATPVAIPQGTAGTITQALGGHYTIRIETSVLIRVPERDGEVLAKSG